MDSEWEMLRRLGLSALVGLVLGLNRDLKGKAIGVRTLSVVSIACCALTLAALDWSRNLEHADEVVSRAIQGLMAGIGFLGGGVILRDRHHRDVRGLTTAAVVWLTATLGIACGLGSYAVSLAALALSLLLLIVGGPFERLVRGRLRTESEEAATDIPTRADADEGQRPRS